MAGTDKTEQEKQLKKEALAAEVMQLSRDSIVMQLRFLDAALARLHPEVKYGLAKAACDGRRLYYNPVHILQEYRGEPNRITRLYLHALLHCIFFHGFEYGKVEEEYWDIAADIAVENAAMELKLYCASLKQDEEAGRLLKALKKEAGGLTAEKLYRYFKKNGVSRVDREEYIRLFERDEHVYWREAEEMLVTAEQWKKISERVKTDVKTFSKGKNHSESLEQNLVEANRDRYDYAELLGRFTVMGESIQVNDDEFDYVYYTYGLSRYGNMPLVEPLEYKEMHKIREFIIALDTSSSCRGAVVRAFIRKTYSILKATENFFHKINIHIIQCDNEIQEDTKITCEEELDAFLRDGKLKGFGATDFRPVFEYVDGLRMEGEFENLKGLIYFTDGYGIYPEWVPDYDVIFAFLEEDDNRIPVPPWAIQAVLDSGEIEEETDEH